jgi:HlyD family secretion protein
VVAVPIIALTVRDTSALAAAERSDEDNGSSSAGNTGTQPKAGEPVEIEGVFVVKGGRVSFQSVELGIAGQEYFEAISGLQVGDTVVAGPYQAVRGLNNGDLVRAASGSATSPRAAPTP